MEDVADPMALQPVTGLLHRVAGLDAIEGDGHGQAPGGGRGVGRRGGRTGFRSVRGSRLNRARLWHIRWTKTHGALELIGRLLMAEPADQA